MKHSFLENVGGYFFYLGITKTNHPHFHKERWIDITHRGIVLSFWIGKKGQTWLIHWYIFHIWSLHGRGGGIQRGKLKPYRTGFQLRKPRHSRSHWSIHWDFSRNPDLYVFNFLSDVLCLWAGISSSTGSITLLCYSAISTYSAIPLVEKNRGIALMYFCYSPN